MLRAALLIIFCGFLCSCSKPGPTSRKVDTADVVGVWTHRDQAVTQNSSISYTVTLEIKPDGTYHQIINIDGEESVLETIAGWTLDGPNIHLNAILMDEWNSETKTLDWVEYEADWWFVDWYDSDRKVALYGALSLDSDTYQPWSKKD